MCDFLFLNYTILCLNPLNEGIKFSTKHVNFFVSVISQFFRATTLIPNVTAKRPEFDRNQKMAKKTKIQKGIIGQPPSVWKLNSTGARKTPPPTTGKILC